MTPRQRARALVLSALYQVDLVAKPIDKLVAEVRKEATDDPNSLYYLEVKDRAKALDFFEELLMGVSSRLPEIDRSVEEHLHNWSWDRVGRTERAILRLGCYELSYREDIPVSVSVNEMVELSKSFCDPKSKDFVNGVLDSIAR